MTKSKFLEDQASLDYKESLRNFMQQINPKDSEKIIEALKKKYIDARGVNKDEKQS